MTADAAVQVPPTELELELKQLIVDALKLEDTAPEDIDSEEPLVGAGLGLDSIGVLEMAMAIHRKYGVKTGTDDSQNRQVYGSVRNLATFIVEQQRGG